MKFSFDKKHDVGYLEVRKTREKETVTKFPLYLKGRDLILDFTMEGELVGIEVI
jgi:hypothetical protein